MTDSEIKFKVGDRVRAVVNDDCSADGFQIGDEFLIGEVDGSSISFIDNQDDFRTRPDYEFELVSRAGEWITWGRKIPCNGVRPAWLADDTQVQIEARDGYMDNAPAKSFGAHYSGDTNWWIDDNEDRIEFIRLPANHFAYAALDEGFEPWGGGDSAPDDYDGGKVLLRSRKYGAGFVWSHGSPAEFGYEGDCDIIGYRKRAVAEPVAVQQPVKVDWSKPIEAVRKIDGFVFPVTFFKIDSIGSFITKECPDGLRTNTQWRQDGSDCCAHDEWFVRNVAEVDTVTLKKMTEAEVREIVGGFDAANRMVLALESRGLIREETLGEKFARETGYEATEAVDAALAWSARHD